MDAARSNARWEFRAWGDLGSSLGELETRARRDDQESLSDRYLVGSEPGSNVKIRDGRAEVKRLVDLQRGFQRWSPELSSDQPFQGPELLELLDHLGVDAAEPTPESPAPPVGAEDLLDWLRTEVAGIKVVRADKRRNHFTLDGAQAEHCEVSFAGEPAQTNLAIEGTDLELLVRLRRELGLEGRDNVAVHEAAAGTEVRR